MLLSKKDADDKMEQVKGDFLLVRLSDMKLKSQLFLLVALSIIMMIIVQVLYYIGFQGLTTERAYSYFGEITGQIEDRVKTAFYDIENITRTLCSSQNIQRFVIEDNAYNRFSLVNYVQDNLNYSVKGNRNIRNIGVIGQKGIVLESKSGNDLNIFNFLIEKYELHEKPLRSSFYTPAYFDKETGRMYYAYIHPIFSNLDGQFYAENIGVCITICHTDTFLKSMAEESIIPGLVFIISEGRNVIASNLKELVNTELDNELEIISKMEEERTQFVYKNKKNVIRITRLANTNWVIASFVPVDNLVSDMFPIRNQGIMILVFTLFLLIVAGIIIIRSVTVPINKIVDGMARIEVMNRRYRLEIPSKNEVGTIAENINVMLDKLEDMTRRIVTTQNALYEAEISKNQAELAFFQSQINPHFLYNTLECIRSMAFVYRANEIVEITSSMAKIFRYSVKKDTMVTIEEELNCVRDYFSIMSLRYMGRFSIRFDISEDILGLKIIKMILQPIVENSVRHGLEGMERKGNVYIKGYLKDSSAVVFKIIDNGRGMSTEEVDELNEKLSSSNILDGNTANKTSIGLLNIKRRLKLNYGDKSELIVSSRQNYWTSVILKLPVSGVESPTSENNT